VFGVDDLVIAVVVNQLAKATHIIDNQTANALMGIATMAV
jgi:hypothetical protein